VKLDILDRIINLPACLPPVSHPPVSQSTNQPRKGHIKEGRKEGRNQPSIINDDENGERERESE
jgi:hypothetical protein